MVALAAIPTACTSGEGSDRRTNPNLVLIVLDDLDATLTPYWEAMPQTAELIAERGVVFENAFATDPICCPARASILSGQYPHNTGVFNASETSTGQTGEPATAVQGDALEIFAAGAEKRSIGVRLKDAGYRTSFMGKYLNGYEARADFVPPGWDEWFGLAGRDYLKGYDYQANHNGTIESFGSEIADYQTDVLADHAKSFVEANADDPFLLALFPSAPHFPLEPASRHTDHQFADAALPKRPNFDEADVSDKPRWIREGVPPLDREAVDFEVEHFRNTMGSLLAVDDLVGGLAATLEENGTLDDTVFILTSDNGYHRGAHRLRNKASPYEESIRVPLVVAAPGLSGGAQTRLVTQLDLAATLFDLAGIDVPADVDGRSLVPLLAGNGGEWRTDFLIEFHGRYNELLQLHTAEDVEWFLDRGREVPFVPTYAAVRTEDHLFVRWYAGDVHEYELYEMASDPYQLTNLLSTPSGRARYATTVARLEARLETLSSCVGMTCR